MVNGSYLTLTEDKDCSLFGLFVMKHDMTIRLLENVNNVSSFMFKIFISVIFVHIFVPENVSPLFTHWVWRLWTSAGTLENHSLEKLLG